MAENSKIEWTHHTFNPWIGCQKVGPGCDRCYAEAWDARGLQQREGRWGAHANQHSQGWKTAVKFGKTAESPWNEKNPQFEAMAIKTVVRALANRGELPMSIEFMEAMQVDEARADYGAFAMSPDAGLTIDAEAGESDAIEHQAEQQQIEKTADLGRYDNRAAQAEQPKERVSRRQAKPPVEDRTQAVESGEASGREDEIQGAAVDEQPARDVTKMALFRQWTADVDSIGFDGAKSLWLDGGELQRAEENDPELHEAMMAYRGQAQT